MLSAEDLDLAPFIRPLPMLNSFSMADVKECVQESRLNQVQHQRTLMREFSHLLLTTAYTSLTVSIAIKCNQENRCREKEKRRQETEKESLTFLFLVSDYDVILKR